MKRRNRVKELLFDKLFVADIKIALVLNCWSFYNRQEYMTVNAYFIDQNWKYHEVLLTFEHVSDSHIEQHLIMILNEIIEKHELSNRIFVITIDNAFNNIIMHQHLVQIISNQCDDIESNVQKLKAVSCLAHVIQLSLKELLNHIRINSINDEFKKSWDEKKNRFIFDDEKTSLSITLIKVS